MERERERGDSEDGETTWGDRDEVWKWQKKKKEESLRRRGSRDSLQCLQCLVRLVSLSCLFEAVQSEHVLFSTRARDFRSPTSTASIPPKELSSSLPGNIPFLLSLQLHSHNGLCTLFGAAGLWSFPGFGFDHLPGLPRFYYDPSAICCKVRKRSGCS